MQLNVFPINLAKASFEYLVTGDIREDTLLESFYNFIQNNEAEVLKKIERSIAVTDEEKDIIIELLADCSINMLPNTSNIKKLIIDAAWFVFVKKPYFGLCKMREGLGEFWDDISTSCIDYLWSKYKATSSSVLQYLDLDEAVNPKQERVVSFLKRYIASATQETLDTFLQFATGSNTVEDGKIKVKFMAPEGRVFSISAKACFKILYVPTNFECFKQFKVTLDSILNNDEMFIMHDQ